MARHAKRLELMPIPPVEDHTCYFEAGPIRLGVEYRLLTDAVVSRNVARQGRHEAAAGRRYDDRGVSLHVFTAGADGKLAERLRFDCFDEDPHYHYVDWSLPANDIVQIDPVADGDPLAWALERIRTRLPQMLGRAEAKDAARPVDAGAVEAVLPRVTEAAYRARYHHDDEATLAGALGRLPERRTE